MTVPCPRCQRPNAPHRETCLYCGATMPAPTGPPAPKSRELPANLDDLVRRAMTGGGIGALKKALAEPALAPDSALAAPLPPTGAAPPPAAMAKPLPAPEPRAQAAAPQPPAPASDSWTDLEPLDEGPPVRLPPARHPWALALAGVPDGVEAGRLATALEVDLATARAAVLSGGARIVLRSPQRSELERRGLALAALGVRWCVLDRADLLAFGPAYALVAAHAAEAWRVAEVPRWGEARPDPSQLPRGSAWPGSDVWLVVSGEVEEKRLRPPAAESRWQRGHYAAANGAGGEARVAVLDLHTDQGLFRVVEGAVDLRLLPGADPASQRRSIKAFADAVAIRWPNAEVQPRRTCPAQTRPGDDRRADGWGAWEEHSRVCRALVLAAQSRT